MTPDDEPEFSLTTAGKELLCPDCGGVAETTVDLGNGPVYTCGDCGNRWEGEERD